MISSAELVATNDINAMRAYIMQHAEAIYRHANSIRLIGGRESLYIITGSVKTDAWAMAAYREHMQPPHNVLQLVRNPAAVSSERTPSPSYQWTKEGSSRARLGPAGGISDAGLKNQSIFLQGFKMALAPRFRSRVKETTLTLDVELSDPAGTKIQGEDTLSPPGQEKDHGSGVGSDSAGRSSFGSWTLRLDGLNMPPATVKPDDTVSLESIREQPLYTAFPRNSETGYHPSDFINSQLLQIAPADVALCHDDDWRFLLYSCHSDSGSESALPPVVRSQELLLSIQNGVACTWPPEARHRFLQLNTNSVQEASSTTRPLLAAPGEQAILPEPTESRTSATETPQMPTLSSPDGPNYLEHSDEEPETEQSTDSIYPETERSTGSTNDAPWPFDTYRSFYSRRPPQLFPRQSVCFSGTRQSILQKILSWATDGAYQGRFTEDSSSADHGTHPVERIPGDKHIVCLIGRLGSGKSTIANTVADELREQGFLAASYFSSGLSPCFKSRQNRGGFTASLASQMAESIPGTRALVAQMSPNPPVDKHLTELLGHYIYTPFLQALSNRPYLIVIDCRWSYAVDCEPMDRDSYNGDVSEILQSLNTLSSSHSASLRFLLVLRSLPEGIHARYPIPNVHVESLDNYNAESDIFTAVRRTFSGALQGTPSEGQGPELLKWPNENDIAQLVRLAEGSFEHMAILLDSILTSEDDLNDRRATEDRLRKVLSNASEVFGRALDAHYRVIVDQVSSIPPTGLAEKAFLLCLARRTASISLSEMQHELQERTSPQGWGFFSLVHLQDIIDRAQRVMIIVKGYHMALFHTSIRDFILDKTRSRGLFDAELRKRFAIPYDVVAHRSGVSPNVTNARLESVDGS